MSLSCRRRSPGRHTARDGEEKYTLITIPAEEKDKVSQDGLFIMRDVDWTQSEASSQDKQYK